MLIFLKVRNNFKKTIIHSLISLSFIFIPLLSHFSPHQEIVPTPDRPSDCKYILSLGHVMVLEEIDDFFVRTS